MPIDRQNSDIKIPWSTPLIEEDDKAAAIRVIRNGWMTQGKETHAFEEELGHIFNAKHVVMVNNGTSALIAALLASGIHRDDEVLVPTMTFIATINAILMVGAKPVLVDCNPKTLNIEVETLKEKLSSKTKALLFVDAFGMPCDIDALSSFARDHNLILIEDAAQAMGARYKGRPIGSFSHMAIFSMHMAKVLPTAEGGCIVTQNENLADQLRKIRNHGMIKYHEYVMCGLNFRITDVQSAVGRSQLKKLNRFLNHRQKIVDLYTEGLKGYIEAQEIPDYVTRHPHMIYSIFLKNSSERDFLDHYLNERGIDTRICWLPVHEQPHHKKLFSDQGGFPFSESLGRRVLSLPMGNGLTLDSVLETIAVVKQGLNDYRRIS